MPKFVIKDANSWMIDTVLICVYCESCFAFGKFFLGQTFSVVYFSWNILFLTGTWARYSTQKVEGYAPPGTTPKLLHNKLCPIFSLRNYLFCSVPYFLRPFWCLFVPHIDQYFLYSKAVLRVSPLQRYKEVLICQSDSSKCGRTSAECRRHNVYFNDLIVINVLAHYI